MSIQASVAELNKLCIQYPKCAPTVNKIISQMNNLIPNQVFRIAILGDSGVGKSTLMSQLVQPGQQYTKLESGLEVMFVNNGILDRVDGVILMCSSKDELSIKRLEEKLHTIKAEHPNRLLITVTNIFTNVDSHNTLHHITRVSDKTPHFEIDLKSANNNIYNVTNEISNHFIGMTVSEINQGLLSSTDKMSVSSDTPVDKVFRIAIAGGYKAGKSTLLGLLSPNTSKTDPVMYPSGLKVLYELYNAETDIKYDAVFVVCSSKTDAAMIYHRNLCSKIRSDDNLCSIINVNNMFEDDHLCDIWFDLNLKSCGRNVSGIVSLINNHFGSKLTSTSSPGITSFSETTSTSSPAVSSTSSPAVSSTSFPGITSSPAVSSKHGTIKVVIVGDANVGKTTLGNHLISQLRNITMNGSSTYGNTKCGLTMSFNNGGETCETDVKDAHVIIAVCSSKNVSSMIHLKQRLIKFKSNPNNPLVIAVNNLHKTSSVYDPLQCIPCVTTGSHNNLWYEIDLSTHSSACKLLDIIVTKFGNN
jgi:GTPase SAR1 family protein